MTTYLNIRALCGWLVMCVAAATSAQTVTAKDLQKAPESVIAAARSGMPQNLFVMLDSKDIEAREAVTRAARGLKSNDAALNSETEAEFDSLKAAVFPNGRLGTARVVRDRKAVPILEVEVPDWAALAAILSQPRVISVRGNDLLRPNTSSARRHPADNWPAVATRRP